MICVYGAHESWCRYIVTKASSGELSPPSTLDEPVPFETRPVGAVSFEASDEEPLRTSGRAAAVGGGAGATNSTGRCIFLEAHEATTDLHTGL